jgi:hypothetical protein
VRRGPSSGPRGFARSARGRVARGMGENSRGPWGARQLGKVRGLGQHATRKPRAASGCGPVHAPQFQIRLLRAGFSPNI